MILSHPDLTIQRNPSNMHIICSQKDHRPDLIIWTKTSVCLLHGMKMLGRRGVLANITLIMTTAFSKTIHIYYHRPSQTTNFYAKRPNNPIITSICCKLESKQKSDGSLQDQYERFKVCADASGAAVEQGIGASHMRLNMRTSFCPFSLSAPFISVSVCLLLHSSFHH